MSTSVLLLFLVFVLSESLRNTMKTNRIVTELFAKRMSGEFDKFAKTSKKKKEETTAAISTKPPSKGFGKAQEPEVLTALETKKFDVIDVLTAPSVPAKTINTASAAVDGGKGEPAKLVVDDTVVQAKQRDEKLRASVAELKVKDEQEKKQQAAALQQSQAEAKAKEQAEREAAAAVAKAKADQEARELKAKAEQAAKEQAEREAAAAVAKAKAEQEARDKAEQAAKEQAEREAVEKALAEAEAKRFKGWTPHHTTIILK